MAVKKSGVKLVAENFSTYMKQLKAVNKANQEAFSPSHLRKYDAASKRTVASNRQLKSATDDTWQSVQTLRNKFNEAAGASGKLATGSGKLSGVFGGMKTAFAAATAGLKAFGATMLTVLAPLVAIGAALALVGKLLKFGQASTDVAARSQELGVILDTVGKTAGYTGDQIEIATALVKKQGITTEATRKSLIQMAQANISWSKASDLARISQNAATIGGIDSSEAFERVIAGIQRGETEILKTIGLNVNFGLSYRNAAKEMGRSVETLTEAEKAQIRTNAVMEAGVAIQGAYEAAMTTSSKAQRSLAGDIKDTQEQIGQLLLPLKEASVFMQRDFWEGAQQLSKGLATLAPLVKIVVDALMGFQSVDMSIFERMGRGAQAWGRSTVQAGAIVKATIITVREAYQQFGNEIAAISAAIAIAWEQLAAGDFGGAADTFAKVSDKIKSMSTDMGHNFRQEFAENVTQGMDDVEAQFPDLFAAWDELGTVAGDNSDLIIEGNEDVVASLEGMKDALEARVDALKKIEDIQKKFNKAMEEENKKFNKAIADENKKHQKALENENKKFQKAMEAAAKKRDEALSDLTRDAADKRRILIEDAGRKQVQEQKKLHNDLAQERRRFELSQLQATRRFKVQDRRLRSEGDILALMDLREDFKLQQQENKENFGLGQTEQKDNLKLQQTTQQEELSNNLKRLQEETNKRRDEINRSFAQETEDLKVAHTERMTEIEQQHADRLVELQEHHEERKAEIKAARDEELTALGEAMEEEGKITKEGMEQIAEEIGNVFGDEGAGDALIKGFSSRTESEIGNLINTTKAQIAELEAAMASASSATAPGSTMAELGGLFQRTAPQAMPMRQGGVAAVTGPATFTVEPGQREAVMFAPLPAMSNKLDVNMKGGFDITGGEAAGKASVEAALNTMTDEFIMAIHKMDRRGTR